ncbi:MAG: apolipoprotein N-acyltransferase [Myxococcales bacterium]|nr:apolipoprotein N-acyltransferase [Myxococcales bacterium]
MALALFGAATLLAFPHELPWGGRVDGGLVFGWLVPAALVVGVAGLDARRAARVAFVASAIAHALLFHWFAIVTVVYGGMPAWLGGLAPVVPALYVAPFTALFAWTWVAAARDSRAPVWLGAALWVAIDWLRGHFLGGFPWATLGYALHADVPLLGLARWGGVYALSFVAAATGIALARVWLARGEDPDPGGGTASRGHSGAIARLVGVGALLAIAHGMGWGLARPVGDASADDAPAPARIRVAAIQGNIEQGRKWDAEWRGQILASYLRLSEAAARDGVDWIVWPETAVPGLIEHDPGLRARLAELARRHGATLVLGGMGLDLGPDGRPTAYYDSAFVVDPGGVVRDRYDKTHLVPFGEYVPLRALLGHLFHSLATGLSATDVTPGERPRALTLSAGRDAFGLRVGVPICYELLFPDLVRRFAADGAGVLLAITNDAWYGRTGAPHQFLAMTALRSAETGRWTVRAANTGISAIIDDRGRVRARTGLFEEGVVVGEVPVATGEPATFYARNGDVFAGLCVVVAVGAVGRAAWSRRRGRGDRHGSED